jgi:hypothetical protein
MDITNTDMTVTVTTSLTNDLFPVDEDELKKNGFTITSNTTSDGQTERTIKKTYSLSKISGDDPVKLDVGKIGTTGFDDSKYFQKTGKNTYKATFTFDATSNDETSTEGATLTYSVTLPNEPISHNADSIDGKTLTWTATPGEVTEIEYEFKAKGSSSIIIIIGAVAIVGIAGIVVYVTQKKKQPAAPIQPMIPPVQ